MARPFDIKGAEAVAKNIKGTAVSDLISEMIACRIMPNVMCKLLGVKLNTYMYWIRGTTAPQNKVLLKKIRSLTAALEETRAAGLFERTESIAKEDTINWYTNDDGFDSVCLSMKNAAKGVKK